MKDPAEIPALDRWVRSRPNMRLQVMPEARYYENQAGHLTTSIKVIAAFLAIGMGIGAVFGAMNTMYALVATRTREIGTLRALGFSRGAILLSVVLESALLALVGGSIGCLLSLSMHGYSTGASNIQSVSEVAYAFRISPWIVATSLGFALTMGVAGGLLPAWRASRLSIAAAVRGA
jgi:putative ABC transport system permease protein